VICTRELFGRHNLRCTKRRIALFDALRSSTAHPSADELYRMLQPTCGMSRATVYNTLDTLCRAGLVRRLPTTSGCRFDADTGDHAHLRMRDTHEIRDVPADLGRRLAGSIPPEALAAVERAMGVRIEGVHISLVGSNASG
jgi:Fe2+ or Zn2+ uptake regulation protein